MPPYLVEWITENIFLLQGYMFQTVTVKVTTDRPSVTAPSVCAGALTNMALNSPIHARTPNQIVVSCSRPNHDIWVDFKPSIFLESILNKTNGISKAVSNNAIESSDDEDGEDGDQDVEGSADHPADY